MSGLGGVLRGWRASMSGVGSVLALVACLLGWHASVGDVGGVLTWVACYLCCYCYY